MSLLDQTGPIPSGRRDPAQFADLFEAVVGAVADVVLVDRFVIELAVAAIVAEGHLLIEDHPGLGKTTMAKALAAATGLEFRRLQCTADLLPADVTGALVLDSRGGEPAFRPGPIFTNIVLADELNRASPRSQSAFLEAMGERQVTVDGATYQLPRPFVVVATQNPFDDVGTMPIPQSQRDRFLLRLSLGYPGRERERELLVHGDRSPLVGEVPSIGAVGLTSMQAAMSQTHIAVSLADYVLDLLGATRRHQNVAVGPSPRAGLAVVRAARALAVGRGRDYVSPEDIQAVAGPALAHRLVLRPEAALHGADPLDIVEEALNVVPIVAGHSFRRVD
jgi:MoxR-like ATPase